MTAAFEYKGSPSRIIFGAGSLARTREMVEALDCRAALVLSTPGHAAAAEALATQLGNQVAGVFSGAVQHTPVDVTEAAVTVMEATGADCTVALGGGSTIGLGKALALRRRTQQVAIPTTYAGSEVTPVLGQTEDGVKTTLRTPDILPEVVIYDPELTLSLPPALTVTSALNAMAHAVEGLYARDRNPVSSLMAVEGIRAFARALPLLTSGPDNRAARADALYGAWLCGTVLGTVGMALHHKLCHVLGGSFCLPHAETHAVVLPHVAAFNEAAMPEVLKPVADALGAPKAGSGLHAFAQALGAPLALRDLGLAEEDLDRATDLATENSYANPRGVTPDEIRLLLQRAWVGDAPAG